MSTKVLIDTNIYTAHEMGYPDAVEFIEQLIEDEAEIIMTTLIEMEIMSHFEIETDPDIRENRKGYIQMADQIYDITEDTELAADIRRKARADSTRKKSIKAPDALVAAAALIHNAVLVSNNDKDFRWIRENYTYKDRKLNYVNLIIDKKAYGEFVKAYIESRGG
ncbi:PIN domain-containing protein [Anoxybacillus flavithermus]|uniref:Predicted nucleic acid-binding protein, contains PIN domain n=1 Tax=Anoxybacillus flavithermus (strain DSM 21510 / WK1) TaxID=491915 RepID=B7GJY4_ANOFW|nr:PIN domain-containing protein [Anoxybacillus flavithermus]ACJ33997.1 Predicted nucleic acid-binding protein, contains PIN domain [Anoxybacillus flavithermus WK1]